MNGKIAVGIATEDSVPGELLNPFVHHLELETTAEKLKTAVLTILLLPLRVAIICFLLINGWILACIGLWGLSEQDLQTKPVTGWRSSVRVVASHLILWMFYVGGFRLKITGIRAKRSEASIIALAPHSSFIDSVAMVLMGGPSIVAKGETAAIPFFGKLINFTQPVYVWRDDPNSRQNTIKEIIHRATSDFDWPQILIFPEGTCTNRSCLITFKPGAFYPGVPVQPVCIRYPNKLDTVTWTWEGPSALKLLWLTLTQVYSSCEIEFLPVYRPSEEEKRDPKLFANNVRDVMAKALGVPVLDYTYNDCKLITRAKEMNLPNANSLLEVQKIRHKLGFNNSRIEESIINSKPKKDLSHVTFLEFVNYLNILQNDALSQQLFKLYDKNQTGIIDFREYLLGVLGLPNDQSNIKTIEVAFKVYDNIGQGKLPPENFAKILLHTLAMPFHESQDLFLLIDKSGLGYVTFENFCSHVKNKAEFANLFSISKQEKIKSRCSSLCPSEYKKAN